MELCGTEAILGFDHTILNINFFVNTFICVSVYFKLVC